MSPGPVSPGPVRPGPVRPVQRSPGACAMRGTWGCALPTARCFASLRVRGFLIGCVTGIRAHVARPLRLLFDIAHVQMSGGEILGPLERRRCCALSSRASLPHRAHR